MPMPDWNKKYVVGKGSHRRPEDQNKFRDNYDRIFNPAEVVECGRCKHWDWISAWCCALNVATCNDYMRCDGGEFERED